MHKETGVQIIKRHERNRRKEHATDEQKTAAQAERDGARRAIVTVTAWVDELREKRQAEAARALGILREAA